MPASGFLSGPGGPRSGVTLTMAIFMERAVALAGIVIVLAVGATFGSNGARTMHTSAPRPFSMSTIT